MKTLTTISLLFTTFFILAQTPCVSDTPTSSLDEPPGCYLNTFPFETNSFDATPDHIDLDFACGDIENNIWVTVQADESGEIKLSLEGKNCTGQKGFEIGLYDLNLNRVGGCAAKSGTSPCLPVQYRALIPNDFYLLMIDGKAGAQCEFRIDLPPPTSVDLQVIPANLVSGSNSLVRVCPETKICFSVKNRRENTTYRWDTTPALEVLSGGSTKDTFFCVRIGHSFEYRISVDAETPCAIRRKSYIFNVSRAAVMETEEKVHICENEVYFANNQELTKSGIYRFEFPNGTIGGCDSVYQLELAVVDTSAPEIKCVTDTFVGRVGIEWTKNPGIKRYDLQINDTLIHLSGDRFTYLVDPKNSANPLDISLTPISDFCPQKIGFQKCIGLPVSTHQIRKSDQINIFPNPTFDFIKIESRFSIEKIQVLNFAGKHLFSTKNSEIDFSKHPSGIYFLKIKTTNGIVLKKIIKT